MTGELDGLTAIDRLRLYATDPDTFSFDIDDAIAAVEKYEEVERRADLVEPLVEALRFYSGIHEPGLSNPNEGPWGVYSTDFGERARTALQAYEAAQSTQGQS